MNTSREMAIEISKGKAVVLTIGAIGFVLSGLWLFTMDPTTIKTTTLLPYPVFAHGVGLLGMVFFGLCAVIGMRKLLDSKPGLRLGVRGIVDNSSGISAGFLPWVDISGAEAYQFLSTKVLVIKLRSPEKYIEAGGFVRRWLNRTNFKLCGSPVVIAPTALKIDFATLVATFDAYWAAYGDPNGSRA